MRLNSNLRKNIAKLAALAVEKNFNAQASVMVRNAQVKALSPESRRHFEAAAPLLRMEQRSHWDMGFHLDIWPLNVRPSKFKSDRDWYNHILKGLKIKRDANRALVSKVHAAAEIACSRYSTTEKLLAAHPELRPYYDKVIESDKSMAVTDVVVQSAETGGESLKTLLKKGGVKNAVQKTAAKAA